MALPGPVSAEHAPTHAVQKTVDAIIDILKDGQQDRGTKRTGIRKLINERFDFRAMSQRTLATNWKKAAADEKQRFVGLFATLIQNTYIGRVEAYTNEKIEYTSEKLKGNRAVVDTLIITSNVEIPVSYKVYLKDGIWWVYDVIIEEVSLINSYRSTYQDIVKKDGFAGLFVRMEEKLKELESQPS